MKIIILILFILISCKSEKDLTGSAGLGNYYRQDCAPCIKTLDEFNMIADDISQLLSQPKTFININEGCECKVVIYFHYLNLQGDLSVAYFYTTLKTDSIINYINNL